MEPKLALLWSQLKLRSVEFMSIHCLQWLLDVQLLGKTVTLSHRGMALERTIYCNAFEPKMNTYLNADFIHGCLRVRVCVHLFKEG